MHSTTVGAETVTGNWYSGAGVTMTERSTIVAPCTMNK